MADATLAEMRNRVLEKLFVLIAGETAEAEDVATVEKVIVSVNEQLREDELCYWADSATPQHVVEPLAHYYGGYLANDYMDAGEAAAFRDDPNTGMETSMRKLRSLLAARKQIKTPVRMVPF